MPGELRRDPRLVAHVELQQHRRERLDRGGVRQLAGVERAAAGDAGDDLARRRRPPSGSSPQISTSESIGSPIWPSSVAGRWWKAATTRLRGIGRLHVGGDRAARRHQRLELVADAHQGVGHRDDDLAGAARRRAPGRWWPPSPTAWRSRRRRSRRRRRCRRTCRLSARSGQRSTRRVARLHRPVLRARADHRVVADAGQAGGEAAAGRAGAAEDADAHACGALHRPTGPVMIRPAATVAGHGSARRQEHRGHRRAHRRLDRLLGRPARPARGRRDRAHRCRPGAQPHPAHGPQAAADDGGPTSPCSSSTSPCPSTSPPCATQLAARWGRVDGVLHAIGFAPQSLLGDDFMGATWDDVAVAAAHLDLLAEGAGRRLRAADDRRRGVRRARLRQLGDVAGLQLDGRGQVGAAEPQPLPRPGARPARHPLQPGGRRAAAHDGGQEHPRVRPVRGHLGRAGAARLGHRRRRAGRQGVRGAAVGLVPRDHRRDRARRRRLPLHRCRRAPVGPRPTARRRA